MREGTSQMTMKLLHGEAANLPNPLVSFRVADSLALLLVQWKLNRRKSRAEEALIGRIRVDELRREFILVIYLREWNLEVCFIYIII